MNQEPHPNELPLQVLDLQIGYRDKRREVRLSGALRFGLPRGSLNAVVGVNGVGKSTLLRTLSGMHPPLSGELLIEGTPLEKLPLERRAQLLSIVLTEPLASQHLRVRELVGLGRYPYTNWLGQLSPEDLKGVEEALRKMELEAIAGQPCHTLSDGQLQRALIARALAQDTPLMLLDEPTTHLDLYHKVKILKLLKEIAHSTRKTILFSTHEIGLAIQLCDQILVLQPATARFGTPCELIEAGCFEALFPADTIRFDAESGYFRVTK
ncbi:ABC transporter ATP-binding protein [Robiginitalea marina]|uniref:ABC transporter ATP-binding protein n=1 Tax=Robiginitalea marina TaxID=2954105 RepID=A0ABT1B138_9FLAO|nr:ABC transporter ATP-binding protein [Robiginitalea marina]MCO5726003.1 ABC transporter ATP-binding protein [Robiginitalea marina]